MNTDIVKALVEHTPPDQSFLDTLLSLAKRDLPPIRHPNVQRLTANLVLKSTPVPRARVEAEATRFACEHTSVPLPRLHHYWEQDGTGHLVMDYVDGQPVGELWRELTAAQRQTVMQKLIVYVRELRAVPQPQPPQGSDLPRQGWIGSPLGHEFTEFSMADMDDPFGPFKDEYEFNDWKVARYKMLGDIHPPTAEYIASLRRAMSDEHPIVFTHGDLNRENVLIKVHGDGPEDAEIVAIVDWEQAGWRPIHWEAMRWRWVESEAPEWYEFGREHVAVGHWEDIRVEEELQDLTGRTPP